MEVLQALGWRESEVGRGVRRQALQAEQVVSMGMR